ncbi:MAG: YicC/YloC family endoribonuclease [Bacteroidota bacterium]|nr:YicC/YloC family endoribonuclease [Bacteroidota bacterium]
MIYSMTGYGKAEIQLKDKNILLELKSLNSKSLDISVRLPNEIKEIELRLRKIIGEQLLRGKIDLNVTIDNTCDTKSKSINSEVVNEYMNQLNKIHPANKIELLKLAIKLPNTLIKTKEEIDKNEINLIEKILQKAIKNLKAYRLEEGKALKIDFEKRIKNIILFLSEIKKFESKRIKKVEKNLKELLNKLNIEIDKDRFEQELIYYLEKYDITEEKVRLKSHINYFKKNLTSKESNGKKLNFIVQEIGREINTIGAKANDSQMQHLIVKMKDELEKIKEQLFNIL